MVRRGLEVFAQNRLATISVWFVLFVVLFCFVGPLIYHTSQSQVNLSQLTQAPSLHHPLGTDNSGFDELGRLMQGGQASLEVGVAAALIATTLGAIYGAVAGFCGGLVDNLMMRVVDTLLAIPALFLLLFLGSIITPSIPVLIIIIGGIAWLVPARLIRGETLTLRTREYVQAVRVMGGGPTRIVLRHVIPNGFGTIVVNLTFQIADAILLLAYLSFLGLGVPPPAANWGQMLSSGINYVYAGYWWLIWPVGAFIVLTVVAFNFIGDALRDALEVRLQRQ